MIKKTVGEIACLVRGEVVGDAEVEIRGARGINDACCGDITFVANTRYIPLIDKTQASAIIVPLHMGPQVKPVIKVQDPSSAFAQVIKALYPKSVHHPKGIDKRAVISKKAKIGKGVAVGAYAVIEDDVEIGDNSIVYAGCYIGYGTRIGCDCLFYANVSIRENIQIGNRVFIQSGSVIGSEGFGYLNVEGVHCLIPQIGTVVIEDEVEIGANVTIDRARFDKTVIGKGTKIDNLVQIAHNVIIGQNSIIVAQAGISGSTHIGNGVTIAGQAGLVGHITIGDGAILAAQAGVTKSVPPKTIVSGYPARPHQEAKRINAHVQSLPKMAASVKELKRRVEELEAELKKGHC
ncbi:MAG: UDP-3-O-(3-hydroxymyristoyl)glucosamine N-acyltransferase [Candidatus Omnitrophota bacterium]